MKHPPAQGDISENDLTDDATVEDLLELVLPPLSTEAVLMFMPATGTRSDTGKVCLVDDVPVRVTPDRAREAMSAVAHVALSLVSDSEPSLVGDGEPSLLVAFHRRGENDPRESDVVWVRAARDACAERGVRLLGVWLKVGRGRAWRMDAVPVGVGDPAA